MTKNPSKLRLLIKGVRNISRLPEVYRCARRSPKDWVTLTGGFVGVRSLSYPHEFRTPFGDTATLETFHDLVTAWGLFYRDEYRVDPSCRTVVDAGANIGFFSLLAARMAPEARIVALEPFPDTLNRLDGHITRNRLADRVAIRPWALAANDGVREMNTDPNLPSQSRGLLGKDTRAPGTSVESVSLATLLERERLDTLDLLKMDIEGSEHEVIHTTPSEVLRRVRMIALEYHCNAPKSSLFERLREVGFRLANDSPNLIGPDGGVAHFRIEAS